MVIIAAQQGRQTWMGENLNALFANWIASTLAAFIRPIILEKVVDIK